MSAIGYVCLGTNDFERACAFYDALVGGALQSLKATAAKLATAPGGAALEALDPDHRDVIVLRKLEELSFREVAARMGRSEDACRMLLARAMVALTLRLGARS